MARNDFNGDELSDILWLRDETVAVTNWLASPTGGFVSNDAIALTQLNAFHTFEFFVAGDFDGDGRTDTLWLVDGDGYFPALTGPGGELPLFGQSEIAFPKDTDITLVGSADFNGDGHSDLLWRNPDGSVLLGLATGEGNFARDAAESAKPIGTNWQVAGFGDFNGDGRDDILWFDNSGLIKNWLASEDGGFASNDENSLFDFSKWMSAKQLAIGDFDGDGLDDLVISTTFGEVHLFATAEGGAFYPAWNFSYVGKAPVGVRLAGAGDFNGDGIGDVLWHSQSGELVPWLGTGGTDLQAFTEGERLAALASDWEIAANGVFEVPLNSSQSPGQLYIIPGSQTYGPVPGGDLTQINGSNLPEKVTLAANANVTLDPSFVRGNDVIVIQGSSSEYGISASVAGVTISSDNGAHIRIPSFGSAGGLEIQFSNGTVQLETDDGSNSFLLTGNAGVQDVTGAIAAISSAIMMIA